MGRRPSLAVIALTFAQNTRLNSKAPRNVISNGQVRALAEAGVQIAVKDGISILYQRRVPANPRIRTDGTLFHCRMPGNAIAQIQIWDEGGKIDLNAARRDLLEAMFIGLGKAPSEAKLLVRAVSDYRDSNTARVGGGSEEVTYQLSSRPYGSKDWPFETLSEFAQVPGITEEMYLALKPFLTVYSGNNGFDRHAAPLGLLALMSKGDGGGQDRSAYNVPSKFSGARRSSSLRSAAQFKCLKAAGSCARLRLPPLRRPTISITSENGNAAQTGRAILRGLLWRRCLPARGPDHGLTMDMCALEVGFCPSISERSVFSVSPAPVFRVSTRLLDRFECTWNFERMR